jgi:hypothetical protein
MKKNLIVLLILCLSYQAHSQVLISLLLGDKLNSDKIDFGLEAGSNWSSMSGFESKRPLQAFNVGFYFDIKIKNSWSLYTGVLVKSNLGIDRLTDKDLTLLNAKRYTGDGTYSQKMKYFIVPVLAKYKFANKIYIEGGPQMGLMYKAWLEYNSENDMTSARIKDYNTDQIKYFDMGVLVGCGYHFKKTKGVTVGVKYYYGFTDVYKEISGVRNNSLFIKVTVPVGAGKAEKKSNSQ